MRGRVADVGAEDVQDGLADDEEEHAKDDISERPPLLQRVDDQQHLHDQVHEDEDAVEDVEHDEHAHGVGGAQPGPALERQQRHDARDDEHERREEAQQPDRQGGAVLVQLEADEAVNEQADAQCGCEAILGGDEEGEGAIVGGDDARVEDQRDGGQAHVDVEEGRDFLAADGGVL